MFSQGGVLVLYLLLFVVDEVVVDVAVAVYDDDAVVKRC